MLAKKTSWDNGNAEKAYSLPSRFFYDPQIFAAEKQGIFLKSWHVVGHESEIAEPGQYLRQDIFEQSVIAVRGQDGKIRAFHNVCQHRGNRLFQDRRGKVGSVIRCGYHSWIYGLDGQLRVAPRSECLKDFDKGEFGLKPVRLEMFAGFVFVNLDPAAQPIAEMASGAETEMRRFIPDLDDLRLIEEVDVVVPANWKIIQDNSIEGYHFDLSGPVHKHIAELIDFSQYRLVPHGKWWTYMGPPKPGATQAYGEPLAGATFQTDWFFNLGLWPNTTFYCFPFTDMLGTFVMTPIDAEKSLLHFGYYGPKRALPKVTEAGIRWMNTELGPEDIHLNVTQQQGLRSFGFDQGRYLIDPARGSNSEHLVQHFHKLCYEAIGA